MTATKTQFKGPLRLLVIGFYGLVLALSAPARAASDNAVEPFLAAVVGTVDEQLAALASLRQHWQDNFTPMALEALYLAQTPQASRGLLQLLHDKTGQSFGYDISAWYQWLWNRDARRDHPRYAEFKSRLYRLIDPKFAAYFDPARPGTIRLDEVRWGGVAQDGIPPLRQPKMIAAAAADYLGGDNIIFGIVINGDARAYPKRVLAWHEMFIDTIGGVEIAGVYCTLCGTVIPFKTEHRGVRHALGTSGFLYRSNKLMYDQATQSLWNTLWGKPVVGPLAEQDIELERLYLVTTTWAEWRRRHPQTQVLSLDTGYQRDYSEGAAYRDYFATDELMFNVPKLDPRLPNKAEVLTLLAGRYPSQALAIAAAYLREKPVHRDEVGGQAIVVLTDNSGASRVYASEEVVFNRWDGAQSVVDNAGQTWALSEARLAAADGRTLPRLPAHRAFWFGWYSAYPHTRLVY